MSPGAHPQLTGLQLDVLRALWRLGEATVNEVRAALSARREYAPTTVATVLRRLEARGLVAHGARARAHVFRATCAEEALIRGQLAEVTERVLEGDVPALFAQFLDAHDLRPGDLARIRALIEAKEVSLTRSSPRARGARRRR